MSRAHRPPVFAPLVRDPRVRGLSSFLGGSSALSRPDMVGARLAYTLALAVLMLDVALPPWVSVPVLYVVPVAYLAWRTQLSPMTGVYPLALTCTVLTVAAWPLAPEQVWTAMPDRLMAITVVWIVTVLCPQHQEEDGESEVLQELLSMCRYCKKVRNGRGPWQAVESYVSAHSHASFSLGLCPDCGGQHFPAVFDRAAGSSNLFS